MTEIDWGQLQQKAGSAAAVLPADQYRMIVRKCDAGTSTTGKPQLKATLEVIEGPHKTRGISTTFTVSAESDQALRIYFAQMAAFGLDAAFFGQGPTMAQVAAHLLHRVARVRTKIETWEGIDRAKVTGINPDTPGAPPVPGAVIGAARLVGDAVATPAAPAAPVVAAAPAATSDSGAATLPPAPPSPPDPNVPEPANPVGAVPDRPF